MKRNEARGPVSNSHLSPRPETKPLAALSTMGARRVTVPPIRARPPEPPFHPSPTQRLQAQPTGFCALQGLLKVPE